MPNAKICNSFDTTIELTLTGELVTEVALIGVVLASLSKKKILLPFLFAITSVSKLSKLQLVISKTMSVASADAG